MFGGTAGEGGEGRDGEGGRAKERKSDEGKDAREERDESSFRPPRQNARHLSRVQVPRVCKALTCLPPTSESSERKEDQVDACPSGNS